MNIGRYNDNSFFWSPEYFYPSYFLYTYIYIFILYYYIILYLYLLIIIIIFLGLHNNTNNIIVTIILWYREVHRRYIIMYTYI